MVERQTGKLIGRRNQAYAPVCAVGGETPALARRSEYLLLENPANASVWHFDLMRSGLDENDATGHTSRLSGIAENPVSFRKWPISSVG